MVFYDKEGRIYNYKLERDNYIGGGATATVYRVDDNKCIKVFYPDDDCYFDENLYNRFRLLSLESFVKLDIPFYNKRLIKAFIMEYIKGSKTNILDMPVDYTLDNFNSLYKDIITLTNNNIKLEDLRSQNIIIGDNKMTVIDYDRSEISNDKDILQNNIWWLLYAFKNIYRKAIIDEGIPNNVVNNKTIDLLFSNDYDEVTKVLSKKMNSVKRPIELFRR